jgi:hypothetical protein
MTLATDAPDGEVLPTDIDDEAGVEENLESQAPPSDETEEVEHEGKKYKIPKPLKGALLMQADYTRKTQEVAEQRRALEERQKALGEEQKIHAEHLTDIARVVAFNDAIARFEQADWAKIRAENPQLYNDLWFQYGQAKEQRDRAVVALQQKVQERSSKAQLEQARRIEEARAALARDIRDWSPELAGKLNQFAIDAGFTADELRQVTDPRVIKLLHAAWAGHQLQLKSAAATKAANSEAAKPLPTVSGNTPAEKGLSDKLSVHEWMKRRNAQIKRRAR